MSFSEFRFKNLAPYHGIAEAVTVERFQSRPVFDRLRGLRDIARDALTLRRKESDTAEIRCWRFRRGRRNRSYSSPRGGSTLWLHRPFGVLRLRALFGFFVFISKKTYKHSHCDAYKETEIFTDKVSIHFFL